MSEKVQPGGRVDKHTYERFREFVRQKHGSVRGNLGRELEKAMKDRMDVTQENSQLTRIENDVATIKAALSGAESDGGATVPTLSESDSTHTHQDGKPAPNSPRESKIEYLIGEVVDDIDGDRDGGEITEKDLRNIIKSEYGFDDETEDEYVELVFARLDAKPHPNHGATHVWGFEYQRAKDKLREQADNELKKL